MVERLKFEASANLQRLIGRELVPDEYHALVELVKNAYDSGAEHVHITIQPQTSREPGYIEIRDDGSGMSKAVIQRHFMWAGDSERIDQVEGATRVPTGEKGIGRFAADALGSRLVVRTLQRRAGKALELDVDWKDFEDRKKRFGDVSATIKPIDAPELGEHGTSLTITRLRGRWDAARVKALRQHLRDLLDPFEPPKDFTILVEMPNNRSVSGAIVQEAPGAAEIEVEFRVLKSGEVRRTVTDRTGPKPRTNESSNRKVNGNKLWGVTGRIRYFLKRPPKKLVAGLDAGVRLYRDGFRVEPFGSPTADWLGISEKRAKRAGHAHIVPSRLFGFVEIHRQQNDQIVDTTSRQALLESDAASQLVHFLVEEMGLLEDLIRTRVSEPQWLESRQRKAVQFERARLQTLGMMSYGLAHELRQPLQSMRTFAANITKRLQQLDVHDEFLTRAQEAIDRGIVRIDENITVVADISRGDPQKVSDFDLVQVVRDEVNFFRATASPAAIELKVVADESQPARLPKFAVYSVVGNVVRNAIDSLEKSDRDSKRIVVTVTKKRRRHHIEIVDNGPGIAADVRPRLFKQFATKKTGGMGVGLYLCRAVVEACGGEIDFTSKPGETVFYITLPDSEDADGEVDSSRR